MIIQINLDKVRQEKEMKIIECLCLQASSIRNKTSTAWVTEENYEIQRFYIKKAVLLLQDSRKVQNMLLCNVLANGKGNDGV